jgi:hypothetical protein
MPKPPLSHYSPAFANKRWADQSDYISYYRDIHRQKISKTKKGVRQWGRQRGLYQWRIETALNTNIETDAARVYESLCQFQELDLDSRIIWAQFLLSQVVRTPTFLRYEQGIRRLTGIATEPDHYLIGCRECGDLACITSRQWCFLIAHKDDFFIRTDNPVFLSGFVERRETCLFYPLSPEVCFVACSMPEGWESEHPLPYQIPDSCGFQLEKGAAWFYNYHFACAADQSLVLCPTGDGILPAAMFGSIDVLGHYPQPPFPLHTTLFNNVDEAFESIRIIMSIVDNINYPKWHPELEPFIL